MADDAVDKLFDTFCTTKPDAMGIGLSVSRSIIERHQGRLWAEQHAGRGTEFSFSIPIGGTPALVDHDRDPTRRPR